MSGLARLVDSIVGYGRAKEAMRLFRERPRWTIMWAMMMAVDDEREVFDKGPEIKELIMQGKVTHMGTMIAIDRKRNEFTPLILAHKVYAVEEFHDILYDTKETVIIVDERERDQSTDSYFNKKLDEDKLYLFEGRNRDFEAVKTRYIKQVLRKRS